MRGKLSPHPAHSIDRRFSFAGASVAILVKQPLKFSTNTSTHIYRIPIQVKRRKKSSRESAASACRRSAIGSATSEFGTRRTSARRKRKRTCTRRNSPTKQRRASVGCDATVTVRSKVSDSVDFFFSERPVLRCLDKPARKARSRVKK